MRERTDLFEEGVEEGDGLNGLAETHLVGEDGVGVMAPGVAQPVETLQLVLVERAARRVDVLRLLRVLLCQLKHKTTHSCQTRNNTLLSNTKQHTPVKHETTHSCQTRNNTLLSNTKQHTPVKHKTTHSCHTQNNTLLSHTKQHTPVTHKTTHSCHTQNNTLLSHTKQHTPVTHETTHSCHTRNNTLLSNTKQHTPVTHIRRLCLCSQLCQ